MKWNVNDNFVSCGIIAFIFCASAIAVNAETVKWGPYSVISQPFSMESNNDHPWKVRIISSAGTQLREVHGYHSVHIKKLDFGAKCNPILIFELGDGGNDGLNVVYAYAYSTSTGIKNLLATSGVLEAFQFRNLHKHDLPELVLKDDDALNQFDHFSRASLGFVIRIYEWNGDSYEEKTPNYPEVTTVNLGILRSKLLRSLPAAERYVRGPFVNGQDDSYGSSHEDVTAGCINYWANAIVSGKTGEANQLFRQKTSPLLQHWLNSKHNILLQALSVGHQNIKTDDSKLVGT